ncbi:phospholipase A2 inhibitor alpha-like protein [Tiliqua scincoides]|uniref:phospholipase A2 inhibitor alpha-like protein n=1 Tax=Tiliqua scincoides TaxID=71010 RepID=UPI003462C55D
MHLYLALSVLVLGTSLVSSHPIQQDQKIDVMEALRRLEQKLDFVAKRTEDTAHAFITLHKARTFGRGTEKIYSTNEREGLYATLNATCVQNFALIPSPKSDAENRAMQSVLKRHNKAAYIDRNRSTYTNWAAGQPRPASDKNCVKMNTDGKWSSTSCNENLLIVCDFSFTL